MAEQRLERRGQVSVGCAYALQVCATGLAVERDRLEEVPRHPFVAGPGHTLQPTALVHEAYLRMAGQDRAAWKNRAQFFGVAACMMRRILVDHARALNMAKRAGRLINVELQDDHAVVAAPDIDVLALDEALAMLEVEGSRQARVAELRLFAGMPTGEIANLLGVSERTIKGDWRMGRAWLARALRGPVGLRERSACEEGGQCDGK